ncbi:MAG: iron-containing alcohol dehydrogenase [Rhodospirillales bacterium]
MCNFDVGFEVISSPGALKYLPRTLRNLSIRKPFVIADSHIMGTPLFESFKNVVPRDLIATVFSDVPREPDEETVISALALYRATRSDGLIVYGGRSALDTGKALLLLASQDGPLYRYDHRDSNPKEIDADKPPFIAISLPDDHREGVREIALVKLRNGREIVLNSSNLHPTKLIMDLTLLDKLKRPA